MNNLKQFEITKRVRRFFSKSPAPATLRANKKGQGFHLFQQPTNARDVKTFKARLIAGCVLASAGIFLLLLLLGQHATLDFTLMVTSMIALCGLVAYDIVSRVFWEKTLNQKIDALCRHYDRLTREVARNRSDIAVLKEGLGDMASSLEDQGRQLAPSLSTEAKMIESIVTRLGALGDKPRSAVEAPHGRKVLELEMAPPPAKPPPVSDLDDALGPDVSKYTDAVVAELVRHAVRNDKIDLFMQPVVSLPQRKTRVLEIYARIRAGNGHYLPATRYMDLAREEDLVPSIDNLLLLRCLQMLRDRRGSQPDMAYMLNISGNTLNDRGFMNDLVSFLSQNHKMASRLIFELPQKELDERGDAIAPVLDGLSKLGCRFSMDTIRNRRIDINLLKSRNIRFIKLNAGWLLAESRNNTGFSRIVRMKKQLDAAGIDLIVEHIEKESVLRELLDLNIDYGQGYLFGKPDHHAAYKGTSVAA